MQLPAIPPRLALAMLIGLVAGTYSTVFIATPIMLAWYRGHRPGFAQAKK